jgi:hypothetical protein
MSRLVNPVGIHEASTRVTALHPCCLADVSATAVRLSGPASTTQPDAGPRRRTRSSSSNRAVPAAGRRLVERSTPGTGGKPRRDRTPNCDLSRAARRVRTSIATVSRAPALVSRGEAGLPYEKVVKEAVTDGKRGSIRRVSYQRSRRRRPLRRRPPRPRRVVEEGGRVLEANRKGGRELSRRGASPKRIAATVCHPWPPSQTSRIAGCGPC